MIRKSEEAGFDVLASAGLTVAFLIAALGVIGVPKVARGQETRVEKRVSDSEALELLRDQVDDYTRMLAAGGELSGTVLVAVENRVIYERAFGMGNYELGISNTVATKHGIASVTKLLTAVLTLKLVDDGVLGLSDPLSKFIPEFPEGDEIKVEHLLRHRSGIPHRVTADSDVATPRTPAEMVELARGEGLLFAPGAERRYSSAGYSVLARVLEVATGSSYADLLRNEVFEPSAALHSITDDGWSLISGRSEDYLMGPDGPVPAPLANFSFLVGAGSVFSTPRDLLAVMKTIDEGGYGALVRSELLGDEERLAWNGQSFGYRAFIDYGPNGRAVIFAGNLHTGSADLLRRDLGRLLSGEAVDPVAPPSREARRLQNEVIEGLAGVYQFRAGEPGSEEALRFSPDGSYATLGSWVLVPLSTDEFFSTSDYATLAVMRDEHGAVRSLRWSNGDSAFTLPRVRSLP